MDIRKLQRAIVDGLEDVKAQDILVLNTEHLSPLFERVIIASGTSNRQTKAIAAGVRDAVRAAGMPVLATEGGENGEWIIVDCGAAVAHIMQPAIRDYYRLEEIWGGKVVKMKLGNVKQGLVKASEDMADEDDDVPMAPKRKAAAKKGTTAKPAPVARTAVAAKTAPGPRAAAKQAAAKKAAAKTPAGKRAAAAKVAAKKVAAKQVAAKQVAVKTVTAKRAPAGKTAAPAAKPKMIVVKPTLRSAAAAKKTAARPGPKVSAAAKVPAKRAPGRSK